MQREQSRMLITVAKASVVALLASAALVQYLRVRDEARHVRLGQLKTIKGRRVHLVDRGSGPCIVLLHGNGATVEDYISSGLVDILARSYRVILFDRPGFGLSGSRREDWSPELEAEVVEGILDDLGLEKPVVVAHSWGTLVALNLVRRHANRLSGLVLMSGYYSPTLRADTAMQLPSSLPILGGLLRNTIMPLFARLAATPAIAKVFSPRPVPAAFTRSYDIGMATRPSQLKSVADDTVAMPSAAARLSASYGEIKLPVTIIAGVDDEIVSTQYQSEKLAGEIKGAQLVRMPGVGHMVHHADPGLVAKSIDELVARAKNKLAAVG